MGSLTIKSVPRKMFSNILFCKKYSGERFLHYAWTEHEFIKILWLINWDKAYVPISEMFRIVLRWQGLSSTSTKNTVCGINPWTNHYSIPHRLTYLYLKKLPLKWTMLLNFYVIFTRLKPVFKSIFDKIQGADMKLSPPYSSTTVLRGWQLHVCTL